MGFWGFALGFWGFALGFWVLGFCWVLEGFFKKIFLCAESLPFNMFVSPLLGSSKYIFVNYCFIMSDLLRIEKDFTLY